MVNFNNMLKYRNCPTLESRQHDDIETTVNDEEKEYGEFPPRDQLFERKELDFYKEDPIVKILMEHYQTFFEKGIDYEVDGKAKNTYIRGSLLWYFNEAFSLCTKLSVDRYPDHYFTDEYYDDIGGGCIPIERSFVLSIVYALLAVNAKVRRQHLKMMDVLGNFLRPRCPLSVMCECMTFIAETYKDNKAIVYEFRPDIERYGYTHLNVDEGLAEDEDEQNDLVVQMRKKVCNYCLKYNKMFNVTHESNPPEGLQQTMKPESVINAGIEEGEDYESGIPTGAEAEENYIISKYNHFVNAVKIYRFLECPAVACLNKEQRGQLIRKIVNRHDNYGAYAVAMLCELKYDDWMRDNFAEANPHSKPLTKTAIIKHWTDALSLNNERAVIGNYNIIRNPNSQEDKNLYKAWTLTKAVHDDYMDIMNNPNRQ